MKIELGATRRVFVFNKFVIKIPNTQQYDLFLSGILANLQEKLWTGSHPDLAKVHWCGFLGLVLIMEKTVPLWRDDWEVFTAELEDKYKDDELKDFMLSDCKPSNWGYVGDHLVKIDYGN